MRPQLVARGARHHRDRAGRAGRRRAVAVLGLLWLPPYLAILAGARGQPAALRCGSAPRATKPWTGVVRALKDGVASLQDHDFSLSIARSSNDELGELVTAYNSLGAVLRRERLDLHQRELMLDTVIQTSPLALVLTNAADRIVFSNIAARQLLHSGRKLEGLDFAAVLQGSARAAARSRRSAARTRCSPFRKASEANVFHVSQRRFVLNAQSHRLVLLKQLTREMAAQEVAVWKKVIRVIAHELNNSLAPISSLANSGLMLTRASQEGREKPLGFPVSAETRAPRSACSRRFPSARRISPRSSTATRASRSCRSPDWQQSTGSRSSAGSKAATPFKLTTPLPADAGDVRSHSARTGDDQSAQERRGVGVGAGGDRGRRSRRRARAGRSRSRIAAPGCRKTRCGMR